MSQLGIRGILSASTSTGLNGWAGFNGRASDRPDDRARLSQPPRDQGGSCVVGVGPAVEAGRSIELGQHAGVKPGAFPQVIARRLLKAGAGLGLVALTAASAILVKEMQAGNIRPVPMASVSEVSFAEVAGIELPLATAIAAPTSMSAPTSAAPSATLPVRSEPAPARGGAQQSEDSKHSAAGARASRTIWPEGTRFFNGRPIRPVKTMRMTVTAYSPDARSCGPFADGRTATLHSVHTNAHRLVAADPRVLPYGSMLSIPGYDSGQVVPVLDCGSAIKGNRLDLLFPTHEQALKWGKRKVTVTVWGYADGKPAPNPRKARDGSSR